MTGILTVYKITGKQKLGQAIAHFMTSPDKWPLTLQDYYEALPADKKKFRRNQLTIEMLAGWMAEETEMEELKSNKFTKLLTRYRAWDLDPDGPGGDSFILMSALAVCGVVHDHNDRPIDNPLELARFLLGDPPKLR